jgi:4-hydroxyphenylpyruvate dioxygenase
MSLNKVDREAVPEMPNRLGIAGIEFIEYATSRPQALGQVLENMGFRPVARHRSREVTLYRHVSKLFVETADATSVKGSLRSALARVHDRGSTFQSATNHCCGIPAF